MNLKKELHLEHPFTSPAHEMAMNIILSGTLLSKEGDKVLRPYGLTDSQFQILCLLRDQSKNGSMSQTLLGNILLVNRSNITGLIDRMEKAGWVKRKADPQDRRVKQVSLSKKGISILAKAEKAYFTRLDAIMASLTKKDQQALMKSLASLRKSLKDN